MKGCNIVLVICSVLYLLVPFIARAEEPVAPIEHIDNIGHDEDGNALFWSGTVFADPYEDELYIIDGSSRVMIYTADFFPIYTLDKGVGVEAPVHLTVDQKGYIYVIQSPTVRGARYKISVFNPILEWERDIYLEGFEGAAKFKPNSIDVDNNGHIYITGAAYTGAVILDNRGNYKGSLLANDDGKNVIVNYVRVKAGRIYLVSAPKGRVYVYDLDHTFLFPVGLKGGAPRHLSTPVAVEADDAGYIYIVDYMRHVVLVYNDKGIWQYEFGGMGWGNGWFQHPRGVTIDTKGRIFIADLMNNRIQVFRRRTE